MKSAASRDGAASIGQRDAALPEAEAPASPLRTNHGGAPKATAIVAPQVSGEKEDEEEEEKGEEEEDMKFMKFDAPTTMYYYSF